MKNLSLFPALALCLMLAGCRSSEIIQQVPVYIHDTIQTTQTTYDSIFVDRYHYVTTSNDTVYIRDSVYVTNTHYAVDTIYQSIDRPVTVTRTETVEVKKPLAWWQKGLMWAGGIALVITIAIVAVRLRR